MRQFSESVRSVERAIWIIEALSEVEEMGITELSRELNLGKATIYRLITTLRFHGYVEQTRDDKYKLSLVLFELGSKVVNRLGIRKTAYPYLEELALITNETVNLGALDQDNVYYIDRIESREPLRLGLDIGTRFPAHCTALGRVLLAFLDPGEVEKLLSRAENDGQVKKYTDNTITDMEVLKKELLKIREQGYAVECGQYLSGIQCVAAPVFNHTGKAIAALSVAGPTVRVTDKVTEKVISTLKNATQNLSARLGYGT